jgi:hypothetical protein
MNSITEIISHNLKYIQRGAYIVLLGVFCVLTYVCVKFLVIHNLKVEIVFEILAYDTRLAESACVVRVEPTRADNLEKIVEIMSQEYHAQHAVFAPRSMTYKYILKGEVLVGEDVGYSLVPVGESREGTEVYQDGRRLVVLKNGLLYSFSGICSDIGYFSSLHITEAKILNVRLA